VNNQQDDRLWVLLAKQHSGEASEAELAELQERLDAGEIPSDALQRMQQLWETPLASVRADGSHTPQELGHRRRQLRLAHKSRIWWVAAAVAIVTAIGLMLFQPIGQQDQSLIAQSSDEAENGIIQSGDSVKTKTLLADGTVVWLHRGSRLSYQPEAFGKRNREVTLIGEAFFDVTKDDRLPFVVHAGSLVVEVKGTAFNVKAYPDNPTVETVLVRGSVDVYERQNPERKITLQPNEKIVVPLRDGGMRGYRVSRLEQRQDQPLDETAWIASTLHFDNERFTELAPKLESWYAIKIKFADETVKDIRFSAAIVDETLQQTLDAMRLSFPFSYRLANDTLWIGKETKP